MWGHPFHPRALTLCPAGRQQPENSAASKSSALQINKGEG